MCKTYPRFDGDSSIFLGYWECLDGLNHEIPREITADEANHLMVIKSSNRMIIRSTMENLPDLL